MKKRIPLDTIKNQSSGLWYFSFAELFVDDSIIYRIFLSSETACSSKSGIILDYRDSFILKFWFGYELNPGLDLDCNICK